MALALERVGDLQRTPKHASGVLSDTVFAR